MLYTLLDISTMLVATLCGFGLGYIIGKAKGKKIGRQNVLKEFPSLPDTKN